MIPPLTYLQPGSPVPLSACAIASVTFLLGVSLGLGAFVVLAPFPGGIGYGGLFVLYSPLWLSTAIPAGLARVTLEVSRTRPSTIASAVIWAASGFGAVGLGVVLTLTLNGPSVDLFLPSFLPPLIVVAYGILAPFLIPLLLARPFTSLVANTRRITV